MKWLTLIHIIDDELRQWFIEERDEKMRMIYEEIDPGLGECYNYCPIFCSAGDKEKKRTFETRLE